MKQLIKSPEGAYVLAENGIAKICPFSAGVPVMRQAPFDTQPRMEVERMFCGSHCPLFDLATHNVDLVNDVNEFLPPRVYLNCSRKIMFMEVEIINQREPQ